MYLYKYGDLFLAIPKLNKSFFFIIVISFNGNDEYFLDINKTEHFDCVGIFKISLIFK